MPRAHLSPGGLGPFWGPRGPAGAAPLPLSVWRRGGAECEIPERRPHSPLPPSPSRPALTARVFQSPLPRCPSQAVPDTSPGTRTPPPPGSAGTPLPLRSPQRSPGRPWVGAAGTDREYSVQGSGGSRGAGATLPQSGMPSARRGGPNDFFPRGQRELRGAGAGHGARTGHG